MSGLEQLTAAVAGLTDREAEQAAELIGGVAFVTEDELGHGRLGAVWRAFACVLLDEAERKRAVIAALEGDVGADGGG